MARGLSDRGRLAAGMAADICVISPAGMGDRATYDDPRAHATGVDLVIVNGVVVRRGGQAGAGRFPGQFVS